MPNKPSRRAPIEARAILEHRIADAEFSVAVEERGGGVQPDRLIGHAAVFDQETIIADLWREKVTRGAFNKTLKEQDVRALFNHNPDVVLGRKSAGTLELHEDSTGLRSVIYPPDNEWGRPVVDAIRRGDISGMSIGFRVVRQAWKFPTEEERLAGALPLRTILEAKLYDVGPVTFPAFPQTNIATRDASDEGVEEVPEEARRLLAAQTHDGLSAEARAIVEAAREILSNAMTAEPAIDHSAEKPVDEPVATNDHSHEARQRELELLALTLT